MIVENLPLPFDRRVWAEATTLAQAGYRVAAICPRGDTGRIHERLQGIHVYRYPLPSLPGLIGHFLEYAVALTATTALALMIALRHGVDVVHVANPPDFFFPLGRLFKLLGARFVFDHHDLVPETCLTRYRGVPGRLIFRLSLAAERLSVRTADLVVSTNESYREIAIRRGGAAPERVVVVRSGPRSDAFRSVSPRDELKRGRPYLVCYLGVMGPNDGLTYLVAAIDEIVQRLGRRDVQFVLIGSGDERPAIEREVDRRGLRDFVLFPGRISDREVVEYLSTADVCVAPDPRDALNDLSTMNKIIEYMAIGRPIVAFDLKEARVSADQTALYARPNDPAEFARLILDLLANPSERARMGAFGRERFLSSLSWEHQARRLLAAYEQLLAGR